MQVHPADWAVLVLYFIFITALGIIVGLRVKDTDHYFLGKRKFGKLLMVGQSFGVGTHAEMPVSLAGAVYSFGISGIWYQWKNLFATPFYWVFSPIFRRFNRTTTGQVMEDRYGPWMGAIYTIFALCFFTINLASMLKGAGKVLNQATGGGFGVNEIVMAMTVVFILYSFIGGLVAAVWTDLFQGFLIVTLSFMLVPLGWGTVGGMAGMRQSLEAYKFSLATPQGIGVWFIAVLTINGLVGIMAQPHILALVGTGKDERSCRVGFFYGTFIKRLCTVGWAIVGLMVGAMIVQNTYGVSSLKDAEDAFGFACRHLLFPGALGLLMAAVLAATMAACSAFMVDSGALFTFGFYRKYFRKSKADKHYLWIGRLSGLAVTLVAVVYAVFFIQRVLYSFLLTETMATYMGISLVGGIIWNRANRWGAVASLITAMGTNFLLYHFRGERLDSWHPTVFLFALGAGALALVVFSLLTKPEGEEQVRNFRARIEQSSEIPGEPSEAGADETAEKGQQLLLVNLLQLKKGARGRSIFHAYRTDLIGIARGWALVAALVIVCWALTKI